MNLIIIRGLPGSGKSTLAKIIGLPFFEADQYFEDKPFDARLLTEAHKNCQRNVEWKLAQGESVIVSNTSTTEWELEVYYDMAEKYNANVISIVVENRHDGESIHNVPQETILKMKDRFSVRL